MILDLRAKQPNKREHKCYFCTNTQWSCNQPPLLLTDTGGYYMFGRDEEDDEWKIRSAAWLGKSLRVKDLVIVVIVNVLSCKH